MDILIKNAILISMDEGRDRIEENIDILIENDIIKAVSKDIKFDYELEELEKQGKLKIIDATGKVILPGLINTHSHVPMSIFRETIDGYNLQDWLTKKIWPMEDKLTSDDIYYASLLSFVEMIQTGCTTINDMYFITDEIIKAMKKAGIRLQTTRTLMDMVSEEEGQQRIDELLNLIEKYEGEPNLTFNAGIHGLYTTNEPYIKKCIEYAKNKGLPIHMHFCENEKEVQDIRKMYSSEPVDVLLRNFKDIPTLLAHAVKLSEDDLEKIKNLNISISHCPISNLKLGCGIAKVQKMLELGINVSLGTDGQGSGSNLDLFETMKITALLQKGVTEDAKAIPAYEVLKMATINGAKALGLSQEIGSIRVGKQADMIIININNITEQPRNDLISQIVNNANGRDVETTIVSGKILMLDKNLNVEVNTSDLYKKCEEIIKRIS